jgi:hypothetical protein
LKSNLRKSFSWRLEFLSFHTAWVISGHGRRRSRCLLYLDEPTHPSTWFLVACFVAAPLVFNLLAWPDLKLAAWGAGVITGGCVVCLGFIVEAYNRSRSRLSNN